MFVCISLLDPESESIPRPDAVTSVWGGAGRRSSSYLGYVDAKRHREVRLTSERRCPQWKVSGNTSQRQCRAATCRY